MSHRVLKTGAPPSNGLFTDVADTFESYYYWVKGSITSPWIGQKTRPDGWSVSEYRTSDVMVFHANDDDDEAVGGSKV